MTFDPDDPDLAAEFGGLVIYLLLACAFVAGVVIVAFAYLGPTP